MLIPGFENYDVSEFGVVTSFARNKNGVKMNPGISSAGYAQVGLYKNGVSKPYSVHRLVASLFLGLNLDDSSVHVDHIDGDKLNNVVSNLRIVSHTQNMRARTGSLDCDTVSSKLCVKCRFVKPRFNFGKSASTSDGLRTYCKICTNTKGKR